MRLIIIEIKTAIIARGEVVSQGNPAKFCGKKTEVHSDLGIHDGTFVAKGVPSHDSRMFMLSSPAAPSNDVVFM